MQSRIVANSVLQSRIVANSVPHRCASLRTKSSTQSFCSISSQSFCSISSFVALRRLRSAAPFLSAARGPQTHSTRSYSSQQEPSPTKGGSSGGASDEDPKGAEEPPRPEKPSPREGDVHDAVSALPWDKSKLDEVTARTRHAKCAALLDAVHKSASICRSLTPLIRFFVRISEMFRNLGSPKFGAGGGGGNGGDGGEDEDGARPLAPFDNWNTSEEMGEGCARAYSDLLRRL